VALSFTASYISTDFIGRFPLEYGNLARSVIVQLTQQQTDIIQHDHSHAKVVAVAGAGKTTTLALFIQQRLAMGVNPKRMLVIMYNKSAQLDFTQKLNQIMAPTRGRLPQVRTFHSLALKIYQGLIADSLLPSFEGDLISGVEQEKILFRLMQQCASKDTAQEILNDKKKWLDPMVSFIEVVKSGLDPAALVFKDQGLPSSCKFFIKVFEEFENWRTQSRRITYSDMLYDPCMLFSRRPDLAQKYSNHMDWVLVDEYQDINPVQQFLFETVAGQRAKAVVIGDPDQTIYEFRGSDSQIMLKHFDQHFTGAKHYRLSTTFRYGHDVALISNQLILQNKHREPVLAIANESNTDTQVKLHYQDDYAEQSMAIIRHAIQQYPAEQVAVLLRLWGMSAPIELAMLQENIPYQIAHGNWVLERYELQTFMMLLEISAGVFNQRAKFKQYQAWIMFLTFPALKIKRAELDQLAKVLAESGINALAKFNKLQFPDLSVWQKQQLENRMELIKLATDKRLRANQLFNRYIRETDFYKGISDSAFSRQQVDDRIATIQGFVRFIAKLNILACDAYEYLQTLKAIKLNQKKQTGVVISSIHRAKGLEWPVVILPALTEHYYPYQEKSDMQKATSIESERRLFYVAMTRAKQQLHLIAPHKEGSQHEISPFIQTINVEAILSVRKSVAQGDKQIALPKSLLDSVSRYIKQLDWPIKLTALVYKQATGVNLSAQTMGQIKPDNKLKQKERVNHHKFGDGFIHDETDRHWHIQFDDGQLRVLDKKIADPHVTWI
jgi:DNA helicase-2/ATP-dependent DNA helicase PcrA